MFSTKIGSDVFLAHVLKHSDKVLDVACGCGQDVIGVKKYAAGVDIKGFPSQEPLRKGYNECVHYLDENNNFEISQQVDAITILNLNAHVNFSTFSKIFSVAISKLDPNGLKKIILIFFKNQSF